MVSFDLADGVGPELSAGRHRSGGGLCESGFPGFTNTQDQQVTDLAQQLGSNGGLSVADHLQIQRLAGSLAATVPESRRPHNDEGVSFELLWGASLVWGGGAVVAPCVLACVLVTWLPGRLERHRRERRLFAITVVVVQVRESS